MAAENTHLTSRKSLQRSTPEPGEAELLEQKTPLPSLARQARLNPHLLAHHDVVQLQRTLGNQAVQQIMVSNRTGAKSKSFVQRVWNDKCANGGPDNFDPDAALAAADFTNCTYVNLAKAVVQNWNYTVYAYTYVTVKDSAGQDWRVCVVGHIHLRATTDRNSKRFEKALVDANWGPGNVFIPGWDGWGVATPDAVLNTLRDAWKADVSESIKPINPGSHARDLSGAFPGAARYPTRV